ncbi:50S ribosomal protein L35 [Periweissella beninensis]|uniref:Large ribosomal subunit protein bL35 n=1 Tax=Periweissella beninensis TaxID=504936 RepID=A0ABT0VLP1_9LACO|nr:50S ribosomal protein L35 [Periweissella beninensis]MBM7544017.1 large subunit ribosomal protein L35 [Periweissella beninensis]MCM2437425.1 50S ribosomal protein L35 [Periweissella beninensis]MCT4396526.1 50S ribosomal protein L35 [Periweissella beninensis]
MPKQKTHRASAKRFKKTANGGLKSANAYTSHRFHGKTKKQRRQLRGTSMMNRTTLKTYNKLLSNI